MDTTPLYRMESGSTGDMETMCMGCGECAPCSCGGSDVPWHFECETTAADLDLANQCDPEVAAEILPAIARLAVGGHYIYDGGAGGLTRYTRIR